MDSSHIGCSHLSNRGARTHRDARTLYAHLHDDRGGLNTLPSLNISYGHGRRDTHSQLAYGHLDLDLGRNTHIRLVSSGGEKMEVMGIVFAAVLVMCLAFMFIHTMNTLASLTIRIVKKVVNAAIR